VQEICRFGITVSEKSVKKVLKFLKMWYKLRICGGRKIMKKRVLAALLAGAMILTGCAKSTGLETEELKISVYKGVEIAEVEKPAEVVEEDVEVELQSMLEANATVTEITDRAVEDGDTVDINFVGKVDGKEFDGGSADNYSLVIGSGAFIDGFEDSIIGHKVGETFDWNGKFPEEYTEELAGKDCVFTITVNAITVETMPELNDEFVKTVSETATTVEEYREELKAQLEETAQSEYDYSIKSAAWSKVLENTEVLVWPETVEETYNGMIDQYKSIAEYYGQDYEEFIVAQMGTTLEDFEAEMMRQVQESEKEMMAATAIAEKEGIELTDEKYEEQLAYMAELYGYADAEAVKEAAAEEELREIALAFMVMDFVVEHCVQVAK